MFVGFSCKQRCTCPSCHQTRTLLTSLHVAEDVCSPVARRQVVLTIPKRLRVHTRFDRQLLGKLSSCARQSVFLPAGDQAGRAPSRSDGRRLIQYMTRCPFSLSRLVKVSDTGQVIYQAEKQACRATP